MKSGSLLPGNFVKKGKCFVLRIPYSELHLINFFFQYRQVLSIDVE